MIAVQEKWLVEMINLAQENNREAKDWDTAEW